MGDHIHNIYGTIIHPQLRRDIEFINNSNVFTGKQMENYIFNHSESNKMNHDRKCYNIIFNYCYDTIRVCYQDGVTCFPDFRDNILRKFKKIFIVVTSEIDLNQDWRTILKIPPEIEMEIIFEIYKREYEINIKYIKQPSGETYEAMYYDPVPISILNE